MSSKGNRSPPSRGSLPEREKSRADPAKTYQPSHTQTDLTGRKQVEQQLEAGLAALMQLHDLSTRLLAVDKLESLLQEIMDAAVAIVEAEQGTLQLIEGDSLHIVAHHGHQPPFLEFFAAAENRASVCGEALKRGERVIVEDVESSPLFAGTPSLKVLRDAGVRAVQSTPLLTRQGKLLGILTTQWSVPHVPDEHDLWRIDLLARQAADLIEHKQAEQALREKQALVHAVVDGSPDLIYVKDIHGRVLMANPRACEALRIPPEQVIGQTAREFHRDDAAVARAIVENDRRIMESGKAETLEEFGAGDRTYLSTKAPYRDANGNIIGLIGISHDITERKQAEQQLVERERELARQNRLLQALLDNLPVGVAVYRGPELRFTMVNPAFQAIAPESHMVGRTYRDVFPEGVEAGAEAHLRRVYETGEPWRRERYRAPLPDKPDAAWTGETVKVPGADDEDALLLGITWDVTEQARAEEALRETRDYLDNLFGYANTPIVVWDRQFRITRFNHAFERLTGHQANDVLGRGITLLFPADTRAESLAYIRSTSEGQRWEVIEIPILCTDGTVKMVLWNSANVLASDHQTVVATIAQGQDITQRKQAEDALRELNATLESKVAQRTAEVERERRRLYAVLEAMPAMVCLLTPDYHVAFANRSFRERFGEANGRHCYEFCYGRTEPCDFCETYNVLRTGRPHCWEVVGLDGRMIIEAHDFPFTDVDGSPLILEMDLDITERKRAEAALRELNETVSQRARQLQKLALALSEAEERERRRIAVILHEDLQQQIAGAKFHLSLVRSRANGDRQRRDIDAVDAMLKDAIEKSRSLSYDLSPAVLHMNDLAEVLRWLANRMRAQHGLRVSVKVWGDMMLQSEALATFLFRAAQEMLFNVVKHAHVGEAAIRVRRIERHVCLSVSDQGQGFDPQELKATSGFGLFSIRERAELLGGRLKVKSAKGKGSRLSLMVLDGPEGAAPPPSGVSLPQPGAAGLPTNGTLRVLLVDNHDVVRQGLAAMLREAPGIGLVGEAPDGREAVNLAAELQPDVVIMDVSMPVMSGDQATRQIKAHLPRTRVLALSMYDEAEKKQKMFEAGAEGYILKTVSAEELLAAIRGPAHAGAG